MKDLPLQDTLTRAELHPGLAPRKVGILGGSKNPPHEGHLHISREAIKRLGLDQVWWLISPQNPMKPSDETAPFDQRFEACLELTAADPKIVVSDFEEVMGLQYSADTMAALQKAFPHTDFVWIMGSDLLAELHAWEKVDAFVASVPLAVFARPGSVMPALNSPMARKLAAYRYTGAPSGFVAYQAPAWTFIPMPMVSHSSTALRAEQARPAPVMTSQQRGGPITRQAGQAASGQRHARRQVENADQLRDLIVATLEEDKVEDLNIVDLRGASPIADYMLIGSGRASTHVKAMSDHVQRAVKNAGNPASNVAGHGNGDWILIDMGDVILHLFRPEVREFYQLDKLWDQQIIRDASSL